MKRNNKKGFTIVELVIVIAVIGILATIMIPTFSNITKNAQDKADIAEARNQYTQFIATEGNLEEEVDYVKVGDNYFDVNDNFAKETTAPTTGKALVEGAIVDLPEGEDD